MEPAQHEPSPTPVEETTWQRLKRACRSAYRQLVGDEDSGPLKRAFNWCYGVVVGDGGSGRVPALTEQFFRTLKAKSMIATVDDAAQAKAQIADLRAEFDRREADKRVPWPWNDKASDQWLLLYAIEQLQIFEFDEVTLNLELGQRLSESKSKLGEEVHKRHVNLVNALKAEGCTPKKKRSVLHQIVNDLQWFYVQRELKANFRRTAIVNGMRWLMLALALFILVPVVSTDLDETHFLAAAAAGFFGAAFSLNSGRREKTKKDSFQDLKMMRFARFEGARLAFGTGAAVILLYILQAGLLGGDLFPTFTRGRVKQDQIAEVLALELVPRLQVQSVAVAEGGEAAKADTNGKSVEELVAEISAPLPSFAVALNSGTEDLDEIMSELLKEYFEELEERNLVPVGALSTETLSRLTGYWLRDLAKETDPDLDSRNLALLLVWCFLAGFFEKLVPKVLSTLQKRMEDDEEPPKSVPPAAPLVPTAAGVGDDAAEDGFREIGGNDPRARGGENP